MDIPARYVGLRYDGEDWWEHDRDDEDPTHLALPLGSQPETTAISVSTEQTPLPFSVVLVNGDARVLAATFAFEDERDRYVEMYNLGLM